MKHMKMCIAGLVLALGACAAGPSGTVSRFQSEPALTGGTYTTGGGITVASRFQEVNGRTALCGLWSESRAQTPYTKGRARSVLASSAVYLEGTRLLNDLSFLHKTPPGTRYDGMKTTCALSDRAWQAAYASRVPDIRMPRQIVYFEPGNNAGPRVEFRQTGPGALGGSLELIKALFGNIVRLPLGPSPALGGGTYSSGGGLTAAVDLRQVGTAAYACGVWSRSQRQNPRTEYQAPEVLARAAILVDGQPIIRDLRFMRSVLRQGSYAGKTAHCVKTGRDWADIQDAGSVSVVFPNMVVYPGPDRRITFSPTGPGA